MVTGDLDGYWMARAAIAEPANGNEETTAEIFICGPGAEGETEGLQIAGLTGFIALRNLLNAEYDRWQEKLTLDLQDIPQ